MSESTSVEVLTAEVRVLQVGDGQITHTGKGTSHTTSASTHLYWGRGWYVWNNTGDRVILRRAEPSVFEDFSLIGQVAGQVTFGFASTR